MQDFYGTTLDALVEAQNERLWFKTQLKLCGLWFKLREYGRAGRILRELHKCAALPSVAMRMKPCYCRDAGLACSDAPACGQHREGIRMCQVNWISCRK